jgi:hypothetical protein
MEPFELEPELVGVYAHFEQFDGLLAAFASTLGVPVQRNYHNSPGRYIRITDGGDFSRYIGLSPYLRPRDNDTAGSRELRYSVHIGATYDLGVFRYGWSEKICDIEPTELTAPRLLNWLEAGWRKLNTVDAEFVKREGRMNRVPSR